jgi:6-phosphogluconolactonase
MPAGHGPLTRRQFLALAGLSGALTLPAALGLRWLLRRPTHSAISSETVMPLSTSPLVFTSGYAKAEQPGLHAFNFDKETGALTLLGQAQGLLNPSFIVVHPNRRWLYATSETSQANDGVAGGVWALKVDLEPFALQPLNQQASGGDWPCHLQLDATGQWLLVANYGSGNASVFPILADGSLGARSDLVQHSGSGPNSKRQEGPHAHSVTLTPDNGFAIVADLGIDQLVIYKFDAATGKLSAHGHAAARPGAGPRHLAFHPNGRYLYAANELDSSITLYDYDAAGGKLTERQTLSTLPAGAPENIVADIHVSAGGERAYVSNRGHNSLAAFDIGSQGALTLAAISDCGGNWPRNFALAPGGQFVLVANQYSNAVSALPLLKSGAVGEPVTHVAVTGAACIQFA